MIKNLLKPIYTLFLMTLPLGMQAQWDNPLVYYRFDETTGSLVGDSGGNGFDSNVNCDNCWSTEGKFNGALHFQGTHKMVLPAQDIALTNEKGTVAFWVLLPESSVNTINCIWWAGEHGGDMFGPQNEMHINSEFEETNIWTGGEIAFIIRDSLADESYFIFSDPYKGSDPATQPTEYAITLTDGTWHHVACTWESGGTVGLYIDGETVWNTTAYNPNLWDCNLMTIGAANERTNRRLNGYLDEFRIYDEALTEAGLENIYNYVPDGINSIEKTKETSLTALDLYPNPAGKAIHFKNSLQIESIEVYSLTGEKLMIEQVSEPNGIVEINIDQLAPGIYFTKAYNNNKLVATGKFYKK